MSSAFSFKQALVVRTDLKMGRGKIAVQCSHAAVSGAEIARHRFPDWWKAWLDEGQSKIVLKAKEENMLFRLEEMARIKGLPVVVVRDRGLTQVPPETVTCIGIGPAPAHLLEPLTGELPLL